MKKPKERLSKEQWSALGLKVLGQKGVGALRIDELCQKLKVTKGSFYWHFKGRAIFLSAILDYWKKIATLDIIERIEIQGGSAKEKISTLFEEANSGVVDFSAEQAIRHWARSNKPAARAVLDVDEKRINFLVEQFKALKLNKLEAETRAHLLYSLIISEGVIYQREKPANRRQRLRRSFAAIVEEA
ncbi:MAG: TetR/AcrR family transcriptional regulator [Rhodospirillaceae bacterium]|jgi:AcrR family transcriptional regulator|nr:TetR/AcrR family transcriptional regulator [Rhodospirillaceae bacterium]MBT4589370.1 TetR/AcrR family transcriptional regulator [Rhodospirillaceae bacterium]MBT4940942.1 TetR/AcrR family transcriptional regulator [Rhodospirillaceae bacterium]MBT7265447.1 TetR/AcrR family transcriptional regulator [Rhodospirillaceae bacterium]